MGLVILGAIMVVVAFLTSLAVAAFFAWHYWRLHLESQAQLNRLVHQITRTPPYDYRQPQGPTNVALSDMDEAALEEAARRALGLGS